MDLPAGWRRAGPQFTFAVEPEGRRSAGAPLFQKDARQPGQGKTPVYSVRSIYTSSWNPPVRERNPPGFRPNSTNPSFWYSAMALAFCATTVNSSWAYPASFAHWMHACSRALPMPSPQSSFRTLIPNSARCRTLSFVPTASIPAVPTTFPSTRAMISISFVLAVFCSRNRPSCSASKLFSSG